MRHRAKPHDVVHLLEQKSVADCRNLTRAPFARALVRSVGLDSLRANDHERLRRQTFRLPADGAGTRHRSNDVRSV